VLALLDKCAFDLSAQGISNTLWSLGSMQAPFTALPAPLRSKLRRQIEERAADVNDQGLANILWGFSRMKVPWSRMPSSLQSTLTSVLSRVSLQMSPRAAGLTLYSLGKLGVKASGLTQQGLISVELAVRRLNRESESQDLLQGLSGLADLALSWASLSNKTQEILALAIYTRAREWAVTRAESNIESVASVCYGLGGMQASAIPHLSYITWLMYSSVG